MVEKYNISIFTGTRAEYSLLRRLIFKLEEISHCSIKLIISGTHLSESFGKTISEVIDDEIKNIIKLELPLQSKKNIGEITGIAIKKYSSFLKSNKPNLIILLGDRYETFAMATASFLLSIPIAHIHGGETTIGSKDNALRHSVTQFASWHFTAHESYLDKVRKLGAEKSKSFCVGPMFKDLLIDYKPISKTDFENQTGYKFNEKNILFTFHPETNSHDLGITIFNESLREIKNSLENNKLNFNVLATFPNADDGGEQIRQSLIKFNEQNNDFFFLIPSLGNRLYLPALHLFDLMIGNSSSGIIEAPLVGMPVINLGDRQKGRIRFGKVIDIYHPIKNLSSNIKLILEQPKVINSNIRYNIENSPTELILKELNLNN